MNRTAIHDLLCGILSGWYESVAEWTPPGQGSRLTCVTCRENVLSGVIPTAEWPHDLMHQLGEAFETAALQIFDSIDTNPVDACEEGASLDCVRSHVAVYIGKHADDILDVLEQCVSPRIDEYAESAIARGFAIAES